MTSGERRPDQGLHWLRPGSYEVCIDGEWREWNDSLPTIVTRLPPREIFGDKCLLYWTARNTVFGMSRTHSAEAKTIEAVCERLGFGDPE